MGSIDVHPAPVQYFLDKSTWDGGKSLTPLGPGVLPAGLPQIIQSPSLWTADEIRSLKEQWTLELTGDELEAIEAATRNFIASHDDLQKIDRETFPLPPGLAKKLDDISEACYNGLGFCVLRGLGPARRPELENAVLFAGVAAYVATERGFQDVDRTHVLAHLFKKYPDHTGQYVPPSYDAKPLAFHTDFGDMIALYYPSVAPSGGRTLLASQHLVYNTLAKKRPDIVASLTDTWYFESYYKPEEAPERRPILHPHGKDGYMMLYSRLPHSRYVGTRDARPDIPPYTPIQIEALDALQLISNENAFAVPAQAGDILFFNNLTMFHGRETYKDAGTAETAPTDMDRHILRLWLRDPTRTTTVSMPALQDMWQEIYGPNTPSGRKEIWNTKAVAAFAMNAQNNG